MFGEDIRFNHEITFKLTTKLYYVLRTGPFEMSTDALDRGYSVEGRYLGKGYLFQSGPFVLNTSNHVFLWPENAEEDCIKTSFESAKWLMGYMETVFFPSEEEMLDEIEAYDDFDKNYDIYSSTPNIPDLTREMEII